MGVSCQIRECKGIVPPELEAQRMCVSHFTLDVERQCGEMRLETVRGTASSERREAIAGYIREQGTLLARIATGNARLPDELKARILSTFLTLMNLRENMERAAARSAGPLRPREAPAKT